MEVILTPKTIEEIDWDALLIGVTHTSPTRENEKEAAAFWGMPLEAPDVTAMTQAFSCQKHCGKGRHEGEVRVASVLTKRGPKLLLLLNLGASEKVTADILRQRCGAAARVMREYGLRRAAIVADNTWLHGGEQRQLAAQAIAEGLTMGNYRYRALARDEHQDNGVTSLFILLSSPTDQPIWESGTRKGIIMAEAVNQARDMINEPANRMTPRDLAAAAVSLGKKYGMAVQVFDRHAAETAGLSAFLAVAQGSHEPPTFTVLKYQGQPGAHHCLALIGKGITFDSGGISLKPDEGMAEMKDDMAGAAVVLAAMQVIGKLKPRCNVMAVLPATENMPGGQALKPGDVISSLEGLSIEVISTDAEGRLILADALSYARQNGATHLVDVATLTGACVVALGHTTAGVMTNNDQWCQQLLQVAAATGEKMWQLPLDETYREQIDSTVADLKNTGGRPAGCITAGMFLRAFSGDTPWVHIDIAGVTEADKDRGFNVKGATGFGVRSLAQLALEFGNVR